MKVKEAIIPAAGFGTRFLPASKSIPKEMLPIYDKPAIHYVVEEAVKSGIEKIVFVVSRGKGAIEDYFDRSPELESFLEKKGKRRELEKVLEPASLAEFVFVRQDYPRGLGHAILCGEKAVSGDTFAVLLPDDLMASEKPCLMQLLNAMEKHKAQGAIAVMEVEREKVSSYGIVYGDKLEDGVVEIKGMVEKPSPQETPSRLAIIGRYVLPREIFGAIKRTKPGKGGEIQLTDAIASILGDKTILGVSVDGERFDVGNPQGFVKANVFFSNIRGQGS